MFVAALLLLGLSDTKSETSFLIAGMLIGCGGAISLNNSFPLSFVVAPEHIPMIMTSVNCLFDASSVIFLFIYLVYRHTGTSRQAIFVFYAAIAFVLFSVLVILWHHVEPEFKARKIEASKFEVDSTGTASLPPISPEKVAEQKDAAAYIKENTGGDGLRVNDNGPVDGADVVSQFSEGNVDMMELANNDTGSAPVKARSKPVGDSRAIKPAPLKKQISIKKLHAGSWTDELLNEPFVFIFLFGSFSMIRTNLMFGTIVDVLVSMGDDERGYLYSQLFFIIQPLSFMGVPLIQFLLSHYGFMISFRVLLSLGALYAAIMLIPVLPIQIIAFAAFSCYRSLLYSVLGTYMVQIFGPINCGRFYGTLNVLSGLVNLLQYPAIYLISSYGNGNYYYLLVATLVLVLPLWVLTEKMLKDILHCYPDADCKKGSHHIVVPG